MHQNPDQVCRGQKKHCVVMGEGEAEEEKAGKPPFVFILTFYDCISPGKQRPYGGRDKTEVQCKNFRYEGQTPHSRGESQDESSRSRSGWSPRGAACRQEEKGNG